MDDEYIDMIQKMSTRKREVHVGKLLRVIANCDNYTGIPNILNLILAYEDSVAVVEKCNAQVIARIVNYLYALPRNGYRETIELLQYHRTVPVVVMRVFFDHYYHNQWIDHAHFSDECVTSILTKNYVSICVYGKNYNERMVAIMNAENYDKSKVISVTGNEYNRKGRLLYTGSYADKQYNGRGKLYMDDQSYYEGNFEDGKRVGIFELRTERYTLSKDEFCKDKRNGQCIEYFDDSGRIRSISTYVNDVRNGKAQERDGSGALLFSGNYVDGLRSGEGYEFLGPHLCKRGKFIDGILTNWSWQYVATPDMNMDMQNYTYPESYYNFKSQPLSQNEGGKRVITPFATKARGFLCGRERER